LCPNGSYIKNRPIHLLCEYGTIESIKYLINNGVNLECKNKEGNRPIHILCQFDVFESIKYMVDRGVNLECENDAKFKPIHVKRFSTASRLIIINIYINILLS